MRILLYSIFLVLLIGCNSTDSKLSQAGEARFRTTYNFGHELTAAELDSLENSKRECYETSDNRFYDFLVRKGIVSNNQLDTSALELHVLSFEKSHAQISGIDFVLETDIQAGRQYLYIKTRKKKFRIDLGQTLLGDRWVYANDVDSDGMTEILILEKYYFMNGDNYDLKIYHL